MERSSFLLEARAPSKPTSQLKAGSQAIGIIQGEAGWVVLQAGRIGGGTCRGGGVSTSLFFLSFFVFYQELVLILRLPRYGSIWWLFLRGHVDGCLYQPHPKWQEHSRWPSCWGTRQRGGGEGCLMGSSGRWADASDCEDLTQEQCQAALTRTSPGRERERRETRILMERQH